MAYLLDEDGKPVRKALRALCGVGDVPVTVLRLPLIGPLRAGGVEAVACTTAPAVTLKQQFQHFLRARLAVGDTARNSVRSVPLRFSVGVLAADPAELGAD